MSYLQQRLAFPYLRVKLSSSSAAALDLAPLSHPLQKSSEWPQFNGNARLPDGMNRADRRNVTNPTMTLSPALGDLQGKPNGTMSGTTTPLLQQVSSGLAQGLSSRRGSPLSLGDTFSSITSARSVPATPLPGMPGSAGQLQKAPGTPLSGGDPHNINGILSAQMSRQMGDDSDMNPSLSRMPSGQFDNSPLSFNSIQSGMDDVSTFATFQKSCANEVMQQYSGDNVYGLSGGMDNDRFNSYGFEQNGRGSAVGGTGSTALYHHNGAKYGFSVNGRPSPVAVDSKMNGLHGPKHKRGDIDRECTSTSPLPGTALCANRYHIVNRFAGTRLEDLVGEIPQLCKDQHGCRYLQKKLEEGVPEHRDMIFRETFSHFADLMTGKQRSISAVRGGPWN